VTTKELVILALILFFALFARLFRLDYPSQMYFDEVYHVPAAMLMAEGDFLTPFAPTQLTYDGQHTLDWLHPPLAKYFQGSSMALFGKTPLAWRLPSVGASLAVLVTFYFLLRLLGQHYFFHWLKGAARQSAAINLALLGTFLFSLDGIFLVMSRLAMNDVFLLCFGLLAVLAYVWRLVRQRSLYLLLVGLCLGLALATKWSALWLLVVLLLHELGRLQAWRKLPFIIFALVVTPFFLYLLSYLPSFWQGLSLPEFFVSQKTIVWSQLTNPSLHLYSSDPLSWPLNWRPVWFFATDGAFLPPGFVANIYLLANPLLNLFGLAVLPLAFVAMFARGRWSASLQMTYFLLTLYLANLLPWIFFKRPLFLHHYLLATPFLLMILAYFAFNLISQVKEPAARRAWLFNFLFWPLLVFVLFYPHWTALRVPESFANGVYFFMENWR
jgi:dolichyl-phosphate-mannose-protein mannosyltransferase